MGGGGGIERRERTVEEEGARADNDQEQDR